MITVHHLNKSRSHRILWLLEELDLPYDVVRYQRDPKTMLAPDALKAVHPLGKSPVLVDGDRVYAESGAIIEHLVEAYGDGRLAPPAGTRDWDLYRYWLHYAEGSVMPPLLLKLVVDRMPAGVPALLRPVARLIADGARKAFIDRQITLHLDYLEQQLETHSWFAGHAFSAADVQMSFPLEAASLRGGLGPSRPRLWDFLNRIRTRPAYLRALARGGETKPLG